MAAFSTRIRHVAHELAALNDEMDLAALDPASLLVVGEAYARVSLLAQGAVTVLAAAIDELAAYRSAGERNTADWLAKKTGTNAGAAHKTVNIARRLRERPKTADALRKGKVSPEQAGVITDAHPDDEDPLLGASQRRSVNGLKQEAARCRQARESEAEAMERYQRAHRERHMRTWTDGAKFCFAGSTTLDEGARLMAVLDAERDTVYKQAYREGRRESNDAYLLDALLNVVCGTATAKPKAALTLRADASAIERGFVEAGERCEIDGVGPIPVTIARSLLTDAQVHGVAFNGCNVLDVTTTRRTIYAAVRRALEARYPTCSVPSCDQTQGLEIDHIHGYAITKRTQLDELDRKCRIHHRLKTLGLFDLVGPPGDRQWKPVAGLSQVTRQ